MDNLKPENIVCVIKEDIDVRSTWEAISEDFGEREEVLLNDIVSLYVTLRGFSYTKSWMEMYKQETKATLQKSKGLRKKISSD